MKNGEIYRGLLLNAEDTMNMTLSDVIRTGRNGQVTKCPTVYLRGSGVRFIALPDLLRNAPAFKKVANMKAKMEAERGGGGGGAKSAGGSGGGAKRKRDG
jgi:small nuclear ribonucleoprotein D3